MVSERRPQIAFESRAAWERWLDEHHSESSGAWLKLAKQGSGIASVTYAEALESALSYGWIDGQKAGLDDDWWLQRFTPRKPRSVWSKRNREKAQDLIARGEMKPAGMREVERARADGRWDAAYEGQRAATVPDDLRAALDRDAAARELFETLDSANRYSILWRIGQAKRPETRARRIERFVAMLAAGEKPHPDR